MMADKKVSKTFSQNNLKEEGEISSASDAQRSSHVSRKIMDGSSHQPSQTQEESQQNLMTQSELFK
jgi:hypothetical protein